MPNQKQDLKTIAHELGLKLDCSFLKIKNPITGNLEPFCEFLSVDALRIEGDLNVFITYSNEDGKVNKKTVESFSYIIINRELQDSNGEIEAIKDAVKKIDDVNRVFQELESSEEYGKEKGILKVIEDHPDLKIYPHYSGRGMFGEKCFGIVSDRREPER
jgi:hypothetical protein